MKTPDWNSNLFVEHVVESLEKSDCKFTIWLGNDVVDEFGEECGGQFDFDSHELEFAVGRSDWLQLLVHEFAHFVQWRDKRPALERCYDENGEDMTDVLWDWIAGLVELEQDEIDKICDLTRDMEHDAEEVSMELITSFGLPINVVEYEQSAAAYIMFYNHIKKNGKWCKKSPYKDMPDHVRSFLPVIGWQGQMEHMPKELEEFYDTIV